MPVLQTWASASVNAWRSWGVAASPGAYELISTTILGSSAASVTFSGLGTSAAAYKHLQLRMVTKSTNANSDITFTFNGSTTGYANHLLDGNGSNVSSQNNINTAAIMGYNLTTGSGSANIYSATIFDLLDFSSTSKNKTVRILYGQNDSAFGNTHIGLMSGLWVSTSAVTSIAINGNATSLAAGSRFSLYGLR
jgi:hypothetical protein